MSQEIEKTAEEIDQAICEVLDPDRRKYSGMTYEDGIRDALEWVLGNMSDEDFEYTTNTE